MKKFWKRANRGLILGGVLILGVSVYEIIDYSRFANGKDEMSSVISGYITDLSNASLATGDLAEYDHEKTDEEKAALYQKLSSVIKTYWTDTHDADDYYYYKKDMLLSVYEVAYDTWYPGYVTEYSVNLSNLSFTKNGPNAALFSVDAQFVVETYGSCEFATPTGYDNSYYDPTISEDDYSDDEYEDYDLDFAISVGVDSTADADDNDSEDDDDFEFYEGKLRTSGTLSFTGELLYEDGGWKISWMDCTYNYSGLETTTAEVEASAHAEFASRMGWANIVTLAYGKANDKGGDN